MSDSPHGTVRYALAGGVATITLDRPDSLNAMNEALMRDLCAALGFVTRDEQVRVVVLTGAGRGFCSGADLTTVAQLDKGDVPLNMREAARAFLEKREPTFDPERG